LTSPCKGSFTIEKQIDDVIYREKMSTRQPSRIYHVDGLALYQERNIPSWTAQISRHIKDIGQQPIYQEGAPKMREIDILQNDLRLT
jgi:hypothetical protein